MILDAWGWCTGTTQRDGTGREKGSGWGTCVYLWRVHVDIWQNQYNIVKLNKMKKKISQAYFLGVNRTWHSETAEYKFPWRTWSITVARGTVLQPPSSPQNSVYLEIQKKSESESRSVMSNSLRSPGLYPSRLLCPWNFPGQNTGVGSHSLFQGIIPTQGLNPGFLPCRHILYQLSYQGSPKGMLLPHQGIKSSSVTWQAGILNHYTKRMAKLLNCVQLFVTPWTI